MIFLRSLFLIFLHAVLNNALTVTKVDRSIDLSSQLVKVSSQVTIKNTGYGATNDVILSVEDDQIKYLSFVEAFVSILVCMPYIPMTPS